jgi:IMP cyclohydrolase
MSRNFKIIISNGTHLCILADKVNLGEDLKKYVIMIL